MLWSAEKSPPTDFMKLLVRSLRSKMGRIMAADDHAQPRVGVGADGIDREASRLRLGDVERGLPVTRVADGTDAVRVQGVQSIDLIERDLPADRIAGRHQEVNVLLGGDLELLDQIDLGPG